MVGLARCLFTLGVFRFSLDRLSLRIVACIDVSTYPERQTRLSHSVLLFCSLVLKAFFYSSRAVVLNSMLLNFLNRTKQEYAASGHVALICGGQPKEKHAFAETILQTAVGHAKP